MNLQNILTAIERQRAAWKAVDEIAELIRSNALEIERAKAKCTELRGDDEIDMAKAAKALGDQMNIAGLAEARAHRLEARWKHSQAEAVSLTLSATVGVVQFAREAIFGKRHAKRTANVLQFVAGWLAPGSRAKSATWIKRTAHNLAWHDEALSESEPLSWFSSQNLTRENVATSRVSFEENATFIERNAAELEAALDWANAQNLENALRAPGQPVPVHAWETLVIPAA